MFKEDWHYVISLWIRGRRKRCTCMKTLEESTYPFWCTMAVQTLFEMEENLLPQKTAQRPKLLWRYEMCRFKNCSTFLKMIFSTKWVRFLFRKEVNNNDELIKHISVVLSLCNGFMILPSISSFDVALKKRWKKSFRMTSLRCKISKLFVTKKFWIDVEILKVSTIK